MQLQDYLRSLRRQWRAIVGAVVLMVLLGALWIVRSEETFATTAELFVAPGSTPGSEELVQGSSFYEDRVKSYALIVDSAMVLQPVIDELDLPETVGSLKGRVTASAPVESVLLQISVTGGDPQEAADIANAVAERFQQFAGELESVSPEDDSSVVRITIVEPAPTPSEPIAPNKKLIVALTVMLGLAIGFAIAVFREALNNRVRSEDDLRTITDVAVVGKIPRKEREDRPLLIGKSAHGFRAEAYRQLRTNLEYLDVEERHRLLVVTSSLPGEGKSVTTINLALTIAGAGLSVCLLEADLRRPQASRTLDLEPSVGLSSILIGAATLDQAVQQYGETGVDVITAGHLPPNPSELLGSDAMGHLLDELKQRYDYVIIDTPPLLAVTDATVLARACGGALVVVSNKGRATVKREQLLDAFENLESAGANVLGVILNRLPTRGPDAIALTEYSYQPIRDEPRWPQRAWEAATEPFARMRRRTGDARSRTSARARR